MSLRNKCRQRILGSMLGSLTAEDPTWKILIVDEVTVHILNACCRVHEIVSKNVTLIENLDKVRQPMKAMSAVYFLSPTNSSVSKMVKDWDRKPLYKAAHVFFTSSLSSTLITYIGGTAASPFIKTFKELNLDFLAFEPLTFVLEHEPTEEEIVNKKAANQSVPKLDIPRLYHPKGANETDIIQMASKLATVYLTLEEIPSIRYRKESVLARELASKMKRMFEIIQRKHPEFKVRGTLIISDRGVDTVAPVLHEFTYQAMALDLLPIKGDNIYEYKFKDKSGETRQRDVILDETDPLWVEFRHRHIAELSEEMSKRFKEHVAKHKDKDGLSKDMDIKSMSRIVQDMPHFQKERAQISLHLDLAGRLLQEEFPSRNLEEIAMQEQNLAVGETASGEKLSKVLSMINPILSDERISKQDKMRLVMIYIMTQGGLRHTHRAELMKMCDFSPEQQQTIRNLQFLGVKVIKQAKEKSKKSKKVKSNNTAVSYDLSRYVPVVKEIGEKHLQRQLDTSEYPYLGDPTPIASSVQEPIRHSKSLRGSSQPSGPTAGSSADAMNKEPADRLTLFVIGGACWSEARSVYELNEASPNTEVLLGSTSMLTPAKFLQKLYETNPIDTTLDSDLDFNL